MNNKKIFTVITSCLLLCGVAGCANGGETPTETIIYLNTTEKSLNFGDTYQLTAIYKSEEGQEVTWSSTNESVAIVTDGLVEAVGTGTTTISATYKGQTATCDVKVTFGDLVPSLVVRNVSSNEINLYKNSRFELDAKVLFNGNYYDCTLTYAIADTSIAYLNDFKQICAKNTGTTTLTVSTIWKNYENSLLTKTFNLNVFNDVNLYTNVTIGNKSEVSSEFNLSIVDSFAGSSYYTTAIVEGCCYVDDVRKDAVITLEDDSIVSFNPTNGVVTAKKVGTTKLKLEYVEASKNVTFTSYVTVNVYSPISEYKDELVEFCAEEDFPTAKYFGHDAKILNAYQNGKALTVKRGKLIEGIVCKGSSTDPITIVTDKGSYVFSNLFVYDQALTTDNIFNALLLMDGKINTKYYILKDDVEADMSKQAESSYSAGSLTNKYFAGTLDGRNHQLKVKVGLNGLFGGFGDGAKVINTHLHFNFATPGATTFCCGLARNAGTYVKDFKVTLSNLYITASNFVERCYAIYDNKMNNTEMTDVYINLNGSGTEKLPEYTSSKNGQSALFRIDSVLMNGASNSFNGGLRNVYVVTGTSSFMPLGCGSIGENLYVTYAKNDTHDEYGPNYLGKHNRHQSGTENGGYCIGIYDGSSDNKDYFGNLPTNLNGGPTVCYIYEGKGGKTEWGIYRYNSNTDLKNYSKINKIGDWPVVDD